jgi:hypothetical protein
MGLICSQVMLENRTALYVINSVSGINIRRLIFCNMDN